MRKILLLGAALGAAAMVATAAFAADPVETPFPSQAVGDLFIAAQTVTPDGTMSNYFAPGAPSRSARTPSTARRTRCSRRTTRSTSTSRSRTSRTSS